MSYIEDLPSDIPKGRTTFCGHCRKLCIIDAQSGQAHHESPACAPWLRDQLSVPGARLTYKDNLKVED